MRKDYDDRMYEMLNEMDQQVADYDVENITDMELRKWKKSFQKNRMKNDRKAYGTKMKYMAAVFAAVCLIGVFFHNPVMARWIF